MEDKKYRSYEHKEPSYECVHEHEGYPICFHTDLVLCNICGVVYCKGCGKQWVANNPIRSDFAV